MAYSAKVGSFNIDHTITAGNTQAITGLGFQPKIVLFWWSGSTATGDTVASGNICKGFGAAISSSSRFAVAAASTDAADTTATYRAQYATECIRIYSDGATTLDGLADFASMDADGFTLTIDDQFTVDWRVSYLALGGTDLTNVYIGNKTCPNATGNYSATGVGFQPDALIIASACRAAGAGTVSDFSIGMATGSSTQGVTYGMAANAQATSNTIGYGYNGECMVGGAALSSRDTFVSFDADGFTLNELEAGTALYYFVCLKGGHYLVGDLTTRTDGNDIVETVGFQPVAILFVSANRALSTQNTVSDHDRRSIGAATGASNRACAAISDEDNLAISETAYANYDSAVYANILDDAIVGLMDIKSIESDGFTCVMDDTDPADCWVAYLAIGAEEESSSSSSSSSTSSS